jgi:L-threonylcarbamoyladenylate synthase
MIIKKKINGEIIKILKTGGVGILPTDTIYGLVGSALAPKTIERIYKLRHRDPKKPMIILISSLTHLKLFNIKLNKRIRKILSLFWPGPVSIILSCPDKKFTYLHRGTKTLAFRLPKEKYLIELIKNTGPLVAPSANLEGKKPATTIQAAKKYFGSKIDFYVNAGQFKNRPSILIHVKSNDLILLRPKI